VSASAAGPEASRRSSRERAAAFGGLLLGAALGLGTAAQPWWRAAAEGAEVPFSGTESTGGLTQALAVVILVGTLLAATLRGAGRALLAGLLLAAAAGMVGVGLLRPAPGAAAVRSGLRQVSLSDQYTLSATGWPWVFALAGLLAGAGAGILLLRSRAWPRRPDRFRRSPATVGADPAEVWAALDAGLDPTEPGPRPDTEIGDARGHNVRSSQAPRHNDDDSGVPRPHQ